LFADEAEAVGDGVGAAGVAVDEGGGFDVDGVCRDDALAAGALPTVTSGVILPIVAADTPAFDKSLTEEYGRPEMIFFAVASPTPGNSFSSAALAVFRSSFAPASLEALGFAWVADLLAADFSGAGVVVPNVTKGAIFLIVAAETPAFDRSLVEEYGRPAIIFLAVAAPTPGKLSNSCSLALFRSTFAFVLLDCLLASELDRACIPSANAAIVKDIPTILYILLMVPPKRLPWPLAKLSTFKGPHEINCLLIRLGGPSVREFGDCSLL
jgi:hypothetical protein